MLRASLTKLAITMRLHKSRWMRACPLSCFLLPPSAPSPFAPADRRALPSARTQALQASRVWPAPLCAPGAECSPRTARLVRLFVLLTRQIHRPHHHALTSPPPSPPPPHASGLLPSA
eukprot:4551112-Pleurochrysis_carterae.AAC.1